MSLDKVLDVEFLGQSLWIIDIMIYIIPEKSKQFLLLPTVYECVYFPTLTDIKFREFLC